MREAPIQKAILEFLAAKRIYAIRVNSGTMVGSTNGRKWAVHMAAKGTADILALLPCYDCARAFIPCWIECKATKGKQTEFQKSFEADVLERGHRYAICRSIEDVEAVL